MHLLSLSLCPGHLEYEQNDGEVKGSLSENEGKTVP